MLDLSPLWISLRIAVIATLLTVGLGLAAAEFMHHYRGRWQSLLDGCFLAPLVLPPTVLGFLLLLLVGKHGPIGALLEAAGGSVVFTWYAAVLTATVVAFPLMYKTVLGSLEQIDDNLQAAARTLGASELRLFWRITLPLALPGVLAGTTLAFARALGEFGATLMLAGNIPGKTQTIPMAIYFAVEAGAFWEAAAWTGVILAITLGGLVWLNRWQRGRQSNRDRKSSQTRSQNASQAKHTGTAARQRTFPTPPFSPSPPSPLPTSPHLSVTLTKRLPGFTLDVSFCSDRQPLGLLGASGAGKSLILRCIAGTEMPDTGRIVLNGRVLFDSETGVNLPCRDRSVGVLFQNYALFPHLTVAENIAFGLPPNLSAQRQRQIVEAQLGAVQLEGLEHRYPSQLSGGQQQRVAMARVLASQPEVLLLDEPFSALDTHLRYLIERDLRLWLEQYPGVTLLVTHNIEEAYRVCSHLLVMDQGRISTCDTKHRVLEYPQTVSAAKLTGCKNISRAVAVNASTIHALDWGCTLQVSDPIPPALTHIGMRAHQFGFLEALGREDTFIPSAPNQPQGRPKANHPSSLDRRHELSPDHSAIPLSPGALMAESPSACGTALPNTFPCWLAMTSETPHRMTLFLKLHNPPGHPGDYEVQVEVFKDKWTVLKTMPLPWSVVLPPERLMLLA
ncbi:molybdate ABC transporter permease subunit [Nodosilinea nodulosa]|uniref:molybdate ABC transporter permease subunit n=1 Tax=Nodosilinea nodulosa TaxID=416001 RepID=UPI00036CE4D0|nr:molybdate ABC transporter permease subunit [Nodosilinea nodulosa]